MGTTWLSTIDPRTRGSNARCKLLLDNLYSHISHTLSTKNFGTNNFGGNIFGGKNFGDFLPFFGVNFGETKIFRWKLFFRWNNFSSRSRRTGYSNIIKYPQWRQDVDSGSYAYVEITPSRFFCLVDPAVPVLHVMTCDGSESKKYQ